MGKILVAYKMIENRINNTFKEKEAVLNIYYTAGYPNTDDTLRIAEALAKSGADMLEIGIPFSDPVADGPTIQESSKIVLYQSMTLELLFTQLKDLRTSVDIPVLLMGYINPILQYGIERFCRDCKSVGIDGVILPDLPLQEFKDHYQTLFEGHNLHNVFLISPNTSEDRIRMIDGVSEGFVYMVSSSSITGAKAGVEDSQIHYFERVNAMKLSNPRLIGFGISNKETFDKASQYANGAIIGSAFINQLKEDASNEAIQNFVYSIKGK